MPVMQTSPRPCCAYLFLAVLLLAVPGARTWAGEEADGAAALARRIAAAEDAQREAVLRDAARAEQEPWLVAEHLRLMRRSKLAAAYAARVAARAPRLSAYLDAVPFDARDAATLADLAPAEFALASGHPRKGLALLHEHLRREGPPSATTAVGCLLEGRIQRSLPDFGQAVRCYEQAGGAALAIGWRQNAENAFLEGKQLAFAAGLMREAWECALGLYAVYEQGYDPRRLAGAMQDLAGTAYYRGDVSAALRYLGDAEALYGELGLAADIAEVRSLRSVILAEMGDLRGAQDEQRALAAPGVAFPDAEQEAENHSRAGSILTKLGDITAALGRFDQAVKVAKAAARPDLEAAALGNRGIALRAAGDWARALAAFDRSRRLSESIGNELGVALVDLNEADALMEQARTTRASLSAAGASTKAILEERARGKTSLERAQRMVAGAVKVFEQDGADGMLVSARTTLCQVRFLLGDTAGLGDAFRRAYERADELHVWATRLAAAQGLMQVQLSEGAWGQVIATGRECAERLSSANAGLADMELARARAHLADVFDLGVEAAGRAEREEDLHYFLEMGRASALLRALGGRSAALRATVPASLLERRQAARTAKANAHAAYRATLHEPRAERTRAWKAYEAARADDLAALREIESQEARSAAKLVPPRLARISDLQRALKAYAEGQAAYIALSLQGTDLWCEIVSPSTNRILHLAADHVVPLRAALERVTRERFGELSPESVEALRTHLLDLLPLPKGTRTVLVSADGELAYIPFAALWPATVSVAYMPSATTLQLLLEQGVRRGHGVLGIGDPDYAGAPDRNAFLRRGGARLESLPNSKPEIEAITKGKQDRRLLGRDATEPGIAKALSAHGPTWRWRAVHVSCHGLLDLEWPGLSALAVTPGGGEDGLLTATEILRLQVRADLVVLSACETGRGGFVRGEGIMGLARAFMHAGAPRVLVSLWKVPDEPSRYLMAEFHRLWKAGVPTAQALRRAQEYVRTYEVIVPLPKHGEGPKVKVLHPFEAPENWAAWVLWGLPD